MTDKTSIQLDRSTKDRIDSLVDGRNYNQKLTKIMDGYESKNVDDGPSFPAIVRVSDNGEVTVPEPIRAKMGIRGDDVIKIEVVRI